MNQFSQLPTLLSVDRICNLISYSNRCQDIPGDFLEFGVYRGGSLEILAKHNPDKTIFGIDSFKGLPAASQYDSYHTEGDFSDTDHILLNGYFKLVYKNVRLVKGFSPDVFNFFDNPHHRFAFVHIDVDLYQSVLDGINFFWPRMSPGGIMLFDDYGFGSTLGAKKAIQESVVYKIGHELKYADGLSNKQFIVVK